MDKFNIILADCNPEEIKTFAEGCNTIVANSKFKILSSISNGSHKGIIKNLFRYLKYFTFPFLIFLNRKKYNVILGWQQFYAINFALFCRIFNVKKTNTIIIGNYTYKAKKGVIGRLYYKYMKYSCSNKYIDYIHVPSFNYADRNSRELNIPIEKFIIQQFGIVDMSNSIDNIKAPMENYSLSIGRSNRDFDFLVKVWSQPCLKNNILVIASDTWKPNRDLPSNIIYRNDIKYKESFVWIKYSQICITPIDDINLCSGDTVLLTGMMFARPVVITRPSTLAEMYVEDGVNGVCIEKDAKKAELIISDLLNDDEKRETLGNNARKCFLDKFSRRSMGIQLCKKIKELS